LRQSIERFTCRNVDAVLQLEPQRTQYDLSFQLFGFPIRVHPFFWLFGLISGMSTNDPAFLVIWICVLFVSILVHELGHAFAIRHFGRRSHIVLYAMGGLAIEGSDDPYGYEDYRSSARTPHEQILISAAGPAAGFGLAALTAALIYAMRGSVIYAPIYEVIPFFRVDLPEGSDRKLFQLFDALMYVNIFWGLINLLPVIPLDGGQISQAIFTAQDPWQGMIKALWLSVWTGGIMAVVGMLVFREMFIVLLFASLAYSSFSTLQQMNGGGSGRGW
jgi:stage IV sporulation protein FB